MISEGNFGRHPSYQIIAFEHTIAHFIGMELRLRTSMMWMRLARGIIRVNEARGKIWSDMPMNMATYIYKTFLLSNPRQNSWSLP